MENIKREETVTKKELKWISETSPRTLLSTFDNTWMKELDKVMPPYKKKIQLKLKLAKNGL